MRRAVPLAFEQRGIVRYGIIRTVRRGNTCDDGKLMSLGANLRVSVCPRHLAHSHSEVSPRCSDGKQWNLLDLFLVEGRLPPVRIEDIGNIPVLVSRSEAASSVHAPSSSTHLRGHPAARRQDRLATRQYYANKKHEEGGRCSRYKKSPLSINTKWAVHKYRMYGIYSSIFQSSMASLSVEKRMPTFTTLRLSV